MVRTADDDDDQKFLKRVHQVDLDTSLQGAETALILEPKGTSQPTTDGCPRLGPPGPYMG